MVRTKIQTRVVVMEHVGMKEGSGVVRALFFLIQPMVMQFSHLLERADLLLVEPVEKEPFIGRVLRWPM